MSNTQAMTGAEAGLTLERQLQIALEAIEKNGGEATNDQIYEAVQRQMPLRISLSQQGRDTLRSYLSRNAVSLGYLEAHDPNRPGWRITPAGRTHLSRVRESVGTEEEDTLPDAPATTGLHQIAITKPFNPTAIKVDQKLMTVFQVMRKIDLNEIDLQPDFQRNFVWNQTRQSRLIESILLRIPLPAFYLDATDQGRWLVVDGLQRLNTIYRFYRDQLNLSNLEYLKELEGNTFSQLPRSFQRQIEDATDLNLYVIQPETPPEVKFMIFSRVNTGGLVLTQQEIRHALFQGRATSYLAELAQLPEFLNATAHSINPMRMDDRECVLRFLAFWATDYENYRTNSFDGFLSEMMAQLNASSEVTLATMREAFREAMVKAEQVFGIYAFRKMYQRNGRRTQISKPLFEVWSVLLQPYPLDQLLARRDHIIDGFVRAMNENISFNKSISYGTGSPGAVNTRFSTISALLEEVMR